MARKQHGLGWLLLCTGLLLVAAGFLSAGNHTAAAGAQPALGEVMRLHVVANSDSEEDQALKMKVRDAVLAELSPVVEGTTSAQEALARAREALPRIEAAAAKVIRDQGASYPVRVELGRTSFPAKAYGSVYLPAGEYMALRVLLGDAEGANWWCVWVPYMCFADSHSNVVVRKGEKETRTPVLQAFKTYGYSILDMPVKAKCRICEWVESKR
jgi:stage II sporulation protein R